MADIFQTVEYSRDKRIMNKVPLALLLCLTGIVFVVHVDPGPLTLQIALLFVFHAFFDLIGPWYSWDSAPHVQ